MHVTIERADLLAALRPLTAVVPKRNTIPIIGCALLRTAGDTLHLSGTDMTQDMATEAAALTQAAGTVAVPAHALSDIAAGLPDGCQIELQLVDNGARLRVAAARSRFHLPVLHPDDFPAFTAAKGATIEIDGAALAGAMERVAFAMSTEETRYYLMGIHIHRHGDGLRLVATDGHRLGRADLAAEGDLRDLPGIILPRDAVAVLRKLLADHRGPVTATLAETRALFEIGRVRFGTRLIDGTFPDYERVIPTVSPRRATMARTELAAALKRVRIVSAEKTRSVAFRFGDAALVLRCRDNDGADATEEIETTPSGLETFEIGFSASYVLDALDALDGDQVNVDMGDAAGPVIWRTDTAQPVAAAEHLVVIMPLRV